MNFPYSSLRIPAAISAFLAAGVFVFIVLCSPKIWAHSAGAGTGADAAWKQIIAMDCGPKAKAETTKEAAARTLEHLQKQLGLVVDFQKQYPGDSRYFEAVLRETGLMASIATLTGDEHLLDKALAKTTALAKGKHLTPQQAANADFQRVCLLFLKARGKQASMRDSIINASRHFFARFPSDPRGPRLLAEAATICDSDPKTKRELLQIALNATQEESLQMRIRDDLKQLDLLGQKIPFEFVAIDGQKFSLAEQNGKVAVVIFWAADSPHSIFRIAQFLKDSKKFPRGEVAVATVSLDTNRKRMEAMRNELGLDAPTAFDGKGWESPLARRFGINALPTIWIFDKQGRLRVTNATGDFAGIIKRLASES
jgi:peroxiredoxin